MRLRIFSFGTVFLILLNVALLTGPVQAAPSTFTVTNTGDIGSGSLRQAILDANANAGLDTIEFDIPGTGPYTITPSTALPIITDPVIIDGYSQLGASPNTNPITQGSNAILQIKLDGSELSGIPGLNITAGSSTVKGLEICCFGEAGGSGIILSGNGGNSISGNFIHDNHSGVIISQVSGNTIGGTAAGARNILSGNTTKEGVQIFGVLSTGNLVQGNFIGVGVDGIAPMGNGDYGVFIFNASGNIIGGTTDEERNIISGNLSDGVHIVGSIPSSPVTGNIVQGNFIGAAVDGTSLGNLNHGVSFSGGSYADNNTIGGTADGAGNTIAHNGGSGLLIGSGTGISVLSNSIFSNGGSGVLISSGTGNSIQSNAIFSNGGVGVLIGSGTGNPILSNSIFSNGGLGIDLGSDGVTPNDSYDSDPGANNLQNFPILTSVTSGATSTTVEGMLNSAPDTEYTLEFFVNSVCDPSGHGEGEGFLGSTLVTTDSTGNVSFTVMLPTTVPVGQFITATATRLDGSSEPGDTSEFSQCNGVEQGIMTVGIDIKPGSDPNSINCNNTDEVIAVAILTTEDFDATRVDHTTVTFEGASETHLDKKSYEPRLHMEDVDSDGDTDLVFHFRQGDTILTCDSTEGTLIGETFDGQDIQGTDAVRMVDS